MSSGGKFYHRLAEQTVGAEGRQEKVKLGGGGRIGPERRVEIAAASAVISYVECSRQIS